MKILIVDDDPVSLNLLQNLLTVSKHEVVIAKNGLEAWQKFDVEPTRVIVSDWTMPELDGLALCEKVRNRPQTEYTYFILLTSHTGGENHQAAIKAGVDDFLTKPLHADDILSRLHVAERILLFTKQIQQLKELLPICMYCKKIRDDQNYWQQIESYIHTNTGSSFSHGVCPECHEKVIKPQIEALRAKKTAK
jgi:phosphoserine phosphatase RsbU/P